MEIFSIISEFTHACIIYLIYIYKEEESLSANFKNINANVICSCRRERNGKAGLGGTRGDGIQVEGLKYSYNSLSYHFSSKLG